MPEREHVLIAVPALDGMVSAGIAQLFGLAERLNWQPGPRKFTTTPVEGVKGYALARNVIAKLFLEGPGFDRLWMIDNDIIPDPSVFALLDVDADIVAPLMPRFNLHTEHSGSGDNLTFSLDHCVFDYKDPNDIRTMVSPSLSPGSAILPVGGVGFGCTVIRGEVLRDKRMMGPRDFQRIDGIYYRLPDDVPPPLFREWRAPNGALEFGEDAEFCYRARKLGYSVKVHTGIEVDHKKVVGVRSLHLMKRHYCTDEVGASSGRRMAIK